MNIISNTHFPSFMMNISNPLPQINRYSFMNTVRDNCYKVKELCRTTFSYLASIDRHTVAEAFRAIPYKVQQIGHTIAEHPYYTRASALLDRLVEPIILLVTAVFFHLNPNVAAISFTCGVIFPSQIQQISERVRIAVDSDITSKVMLAVGIVFFFIRAMPAFLNIATVYYAATLGTKLYESGRRNQPPPVQPQAQEPPRRRRSNSISHAPSIPIAV